MPVDNICKTPNPKLTDTLLFLHTTKSTISSRTLHKRLVTDSTLRPLNSDSSFPLMLIKFSSSNSYGIYVMLASFSTSLKTVFGPGQYMYKPSIFAKVPKNKVSTIAPLSSNVFTCLHMIYQSLIAILSCWVRCCFCWVDERSLEIDRFLYSDS